MLCMCANVSSRYIIRSWHKQMWNVVFFMGNIIERNMKTILVLLYDSIHISTQNQQRKAEVNDNYDWSIFIRLHTYFYSIYFRNKISFDGSINPWNKFDFFHSNSFDRMASVFIHKYNPTKTLSLQFSLFK